MGRRRNGLLDDVAAMPWPVGLGVGVGGYLVIAHLAPAWFARGDGIWMRALASLASMFSLFGWLFLGACALAAFVSWLRARRTRELLDTRRGLDDIAALGWRDFERLVGEAYRRKGYTVEETGLGGADGGIDLVLRRDGKRILVQCKQWRREKVPVNVVREMYGLLAHHRANAVHIAALGGFTPDAARFATGKPIELVDGATLLAMIREAQAARWVEPQHTAQVEPVLLASTETAARPDCPRCGAKMVIRNTRREGKFFWGCSDFPRCRATRDAVVTGSLDWAIRSRRSS